MTQDWLPYGRQSIDDDDVAAVVRALQSDFLTTGPAVEAFETALADRVGARFAVACSSGTAALHLAAMALELGPGDAVLSSPITFLGATNAILHTGADVCFADVEPESANLDPAAAARVLAERSERIRAIFPVHFAGAPADMLAFAALAAQHGIPIVEDAAHAIGATYRTPDGTEIRVGSCAHSLMTTFSFHPVKQVTAGEGGAVTTNDERMAHVVRTLRNHGIERAPFADPDASQEADGTVRPWYHEVRTRPGFNYRLSDVHAALAHSQLRRLDAFLKRRQELTAAYMERLATSAMAPLVTPLPATTRTGHGLHLFVVRIGFAHAGTTRTALMRVLADAGIGTQVHYIPVPFQPYYRARYGEPDVPEAAAYYHTCLTLPLYPDMPDDAVDRVVAALERALADAAG